MSGDVVRFPATSLEYTVTTHVSVKLMTGIDQPTPPVATPLPHPSLTQVIAPEAASPDPPVSAAVPAKDTGVVVTVEAPSVSAVPIGAWVMTTVGPAWRSASYVATMARSPR